MIKRLFLIFFVTVFFLSSCDVVLATLNETANAVATDVARTQAAENQIATLAPTTIAARSSATQPANTRAAATSTSAATTRVTATPNDGLKTIRIDQLPAEARKTISLIDKGGPFPYDRDGIVFQNREGLLPKKSSDYYHEYTVDTPGSSDRGARRIIVGDNGELYYTDDHYDSFKRVVR